MLASPFPIASGSEAELIEGLVRSRIIENWESQDEPEHLRTICDRILSNEQRAGYLLELYQQIWDAGEVAANNSEEEARLQLSGSNTSRERSCQSWVVNLLRASPKTFPCFHSNRFMEQLLSILPIADAIEALIVVWETSTAEEWVNQIMSLPF